MTYMCYRYINRGLYEKDKLTFVLLVTMKILITAALLKTTDLTIFLRGGAALDINSVRTGDTTKAVSYDDNSFSIYPGLSSLGAQVHHRISGPILNNVMFRCV